MLPDANPVCCKSCHWDAPKQIRTDLTGAFGHDAMEHSSARGESAFAIREQRVG
jgi:hypothetical protein